MARLGGILAACFLALAPSLAQAEEGISVRRGRILYKSGKYSDAIAELRSAVQLLGVACINMGDYEAAKRYFDKLRAIAP